MKRKRLRIKSLLSSREKIACVREVDRESGIGREDEDDRATMRRLGNRENEGRKEGREEGRRKTTKRSSMAAWREDRVQSCRTVSSSSA